MAEKDPICSKVRENLTAYLDGELGEGPRHMIQEHLDGCPDCQATLAALKESWQLLDELEAPIIERRPSAALEQKILERVRQEQAMGPLPAAARRWFTWRRAASAAATLAAAGLLALGLWTSSQPQEREPTPAERQCITYLDLLQNLETLRNMDEVKYLERRLGQPADQALPAEPGQGTNGV